MEKFLILFPPVKPLTETEAQLFWKENYRDSRTEIKKTIQLDYNFLPIIKPSVVRTHCERFVHSGYFVVAHINNANGYRISQEV